MSENIVGSVMDANNRTVKFGRDTGKPCPSCQPRGKFTMRVVACTDGMAQLECENCGARDFQPATPADR